MNLAFKSVPLVLTCLALTSATAMADGVPGITLPEGVEARGGEFISHKDDMEMVLVPAGEFSMGSDRGSYDEKPMHRVALQSYLMDKHEVTIEQFAKFVAQSGYKPQGPWQRSGAVAQGRLPVRFVTWFDAQAYARWAGRTLPTEAQWEKAAAGSEARAYPWGSAYVPGRAQAGVEAAAGPVAVGSFPQGASAYGCLDMAGNLWEWVADWYDRYGYAKAQGTTAEPHGPADGAPPDARFVQSGTASGNEVSTLKVIRGGGWSSSPDLLRSAKRMWGNPRYWLNDTGFRCALPLGRSK